MRRAESDSTQRHPVLRIVVDQLPIPERQPSFCWRNHWLTGYDSAYALFSKFCFLNGLTARELAEIVVTPHRGIKGRLVQSLNADLRDPGLFDLMRIAQLCEASLEIISGAFVLGRSLNSVTESSDTLRFCRDCMAVGFHSSLFQIMFVPRCPLHRQAFDTCCTQCGGIQPYRLTAAVFNRPFSCVHCGHCWASKLPTRVGSDLRFSPSRRERLEGARHTATAKAQFFGCGRELDRYFAFYGRGHVALSPPSLQRKRDEYYQFIDAVVCSVRPDLEWDHCERTRLLVVERGAHRAYTRPFRSLKKSGKSTATLSGEFGWDEKLWALLPIYKSVRRRIWRATIAHHRACVSAAAERMWWDVEGETFVRICPLAEAFLSWRMFWEGLAVPADLFKRPRHVPYGLLGWLSQAAPLCSPNWTKGGERWLTHRIFAMDCIRNFHEWLSLCANQSRSKTHCWLRSEACGYVLTYWLASGGDCAKSPLRVFMDVGAITTSDAVCATKVDAVHAQWHQAQLDQVRR